MKVQQLTAKVTERATTLAGSAAGTVVDPKTGLSKLTSMLRQPSVLFGIAILALAYGVARVTRRNG